MDPATRLDGVSAIAVLLIAAFAIDRVVSAILFLLDFVPAWKKMLPVPSLQPEGAARLDAEHMRKFVYFTLSGLFSVGVVIALSGMRTVDGAGKAGTGILFALGFQQHWIDIVLTMLILMGGAERISEALKNIDSSKAAGEKATPIQIQGTLALNPEDWTALGKAATHGR